MTWMHKSGRAWHYAVPGSVRFACGSFYLMGNWEESTAIPARGLAICRRCERLMLHAVSNAMSYRGQSQRRPHVAAKP